MDTYVKRLEDLQAIAESFGGVERSFAVQAGREVRILVRPEEIDDLTASRLARDIVKKIEEQLTYPGQIKVTVIRETRAVEYAKSDPAIRDRGSLFGQDEPAQGDERPQMSVDTEPTERIGHVVLDGLRADPQPRRHALVVMLFGIHP